MRIGSPPFNSDPKPNCLHVSLDGTMGLAVSTAGPDGLAAELNLLLAGR